MAAAEEERKIAQEPTHTKVKILPSLSSLLRLTEAAQRRDRETD